MCSSIWVGKISKAYCSTCVAVADFVLDTPFFTEVLPVECSVVDWGLAASSGALLQALPLLYRTRCLLASDAKKREEHFVNAIRRKRGISIFFWKMVSKCCTVDELLSFALFPPPPPFSASQPIPRPDSASASWNCVLSTCKLRGFSTRWGGGWLG